MEKAYTAQEVADMFKVSKNTVINWRRQGKLPYLKIGRVILFKESDIQKLVDESTRTDTCKD